MSERPRLVRWALRGLGVLAIAALAFGAGELTALAYYTLRDGGLAWPAQRLEAERNAYTEGVREEGCSYGDSMLVHPWLAHVQTPLGPCGASYANSKGLIGREFPDLAPEGTGVILVTGGSVAAQFTWDNRKTPSALEEILNREFAGGRYERFVVLNGGHGAWKQPNQYVLFGLYAHVLAGLITLDGYNEHYMIGASRRFELPSNNFFQSLERQDARVVSAPYRHAALKMEADLFRYALEHDVFRRSHLAYLLVDRARGMLRGYASRADWDDEGTAEDTWIRASYERMFELHEDTPKALRTELSLAEYAKYVRLMHAGAEALGIPSLFLIQPTPAYQKPLDPEEEPYADATDREAYDALVARLLSLREEGVPVFSLLDVFAGVREPIYTDHIHVNAEGNRRMAGRVAALIEREWGWPRARRGAAAPRP